MAGAANLENDERTANGHHEANQQQEREQELGGAESARGQTEQVVETPVRMSEAQVNNAEAPKRQKHPSAGNMVIYSSSEGFPKPSVEADGGDCIVDLPFTPVSGEGPRFLGRTKDDTLVALTNYRIFVAPAPSSSPLINVPLGLLEAVELRDLFYIHLACKDSRCYRVALSDNAVAEMWYSRLRQAIAPPTKMEDVFALAHFAWAQEENMEEQGVLTTDGAVPSIDSEIKRMEFDLEGSWRLTEANRNYKLCSTYPEKLIVPAGVTDDHLKVVAGYRAGRRIPAVVWRHTRSGAVLARCSQPEVGWWGWRSDKDEKYVEALAQSCHYDRTRVRCASGSVDDASSVVEVEAANGDIDGHKNINNDLDVEVKSEGAARNQRLKKVLVMDARSYAAAFANRVRGGGMECAEYYDCCEVEFMNLANIHEVRKSFLRLRGLINSTSDQSTWFSNLESTKWLYYLSCLLSSAVRCARALDEEERPVVVHCSDGWDRTSQISSLAQLLLDPYYRTIEGFEVLVEREWLSFGHKMSDRNGNPLATSDANERCPIFLQWLDCVHQLLFQFPCAFQFNNSYLIKLARHTYSNLFGTFLCNNDRERKEHNVKSRTRSVWMYLRYDMGRYVNYLYKEDRENGCLRPKTDVRCLFLWQDMYTDFVATQSCPFANGGTSSDGVNGGSNGSGGGTESGGSLEESPSPSPKQAMPGSGAVETAVTLADGLAERVLSVANGMRSMLRDDLEGENLSPSVIVSENKHVSEAEVQAAVVPAKESIVIEKQSDDEVDADESKSDQRNDTYESATKFKVRYILITHTTCYLIHIFSIVW